MAEGDVFVSQLEMFFLLLIGHAVADFCLQTDWIARSKNRHAVPAGYDPKLHGPQQTIWPYVLSAHALTHGGAVYVDRKRQVGVSRVDLSLAH